VSIKPLLHGVVSNFRRQLHFCVLHYGKSWIDIRPTRLIGDCANSLLEHNMTPRLAILLLQSPIEIWKKCTTDPVTACIVQPTGFKSQADFFKTTQITRQNGELRDPGRLKILTCMQNAQPRGVSSKFKTTHCLDEAEFVHTLPSCVFQVQCRHCSPRLLTTNTFIKLRTPSHPIKRIQQRNHSCPTTRDTEALLPRLPGQTGASLTAR
jgi:hypothetical protein